MMRIAVLPGDDIGPEITEATLTVLQAVDAVYDLGLKFEVSEVGMAAYRKHRTTLPDAVLEQARRADGILLGPAGITAYPPRSEGGLNVPGTVRKTFDLFANIRPARSRPARIGGARRISTGEKPSDLTDLTPLPAGRVRSFRIARVPTG